MSHRTGIIAAPEGAVLDPDQHFEALRALTLATVAASSARVYAQTYRLWEVYCQQQALEPLDLRPAAVLAFLAAQDVTKTTRQRQLAALRKLAQLAFILTGTEESRRIHEALKLVKVPAGTGGKERSRRALSPAEADRLFRVWREPSPLHRRNHALLCLLALGGIRRSEAAALRWSEVDFDNGVISIRHGKGDKPREVPLAGDLALEALKDWQQVQKQLSVFSDQLSAKEENIAAQRQADSCLLKASFEMGREYVFCPVRKGGHLGTDKPITGMDVYRVVQATEKATGMKFKPHDLRRTFITEALATGTPLATVQAAVGHARGETTLSYAQAVNARQARRELRLRYGG
jgi:integrase